MQKRISFLWKKAFVRDVFTLQVGSVFRFGIGFLKSVIFARLLGLEGFGMYAVALSFTGTFKIFTGFGQEQALLSYLAEEYGKKNTQGMQALIKYFCLVTLFAGVLLCSLALLSPLLTSVLYPESAKMVMAMAVLGFLGFVVSLPHPLVIALLQIVRDVRMMTILENTNLLLQLILSVCFVLLGWGPLGVFLGLFFSNLIMTIVYGLLFFRLRHRYRLPGIRESLWSTVSIRSYVQQGLWIAMDKNIVNVFPQALLFLLSVSAAPSVVGVAQLALKVANLPTGLFFAHVVRMANTVLPTLKNKGVSFLRKQCFLLIRHALCFHWLLVFGGIITLPFIVPIAYGQEFTGVIMPMLWILLIRLLQPFNVANSALMRIFRKVHVSTIWNVARIPLELGLFLFFLQNFSPITSFVVAIFLHQIGAFALNWYVYRSLLGIRFYML